MVLAASPESVTVEAAAKWLRAAMSRKSSSCKSFEEITNFLKPLSESVAKQAVCIGNSNGKAPLHFASQNVIGDKNGSALVETLIQYGANVNHTTRRGHTPLIFAAGRGHNDIVQVLLRHGADPRITVVTGDTALSMGRTRLDADTVAQLEAAESGSTTTWRDYRNVADAHQAQSEHVKTCPHCRKKLLQKEAEAEEIRINSVSAGLSVQLEMAMTFGRSEEQEGLAKARAELAELIIPIAMSSSDRPALEPALCEAFQHIFHSDISMLPKILELCQEHQLLSVFQAAGCRDLRAVRPIPAALLASLKALPEFVHATSAECICQSADTLLAVEILLLKNNLVISDGDVIDALWRTRLANRLTELSASSFMPALWPGSSKKEGGPVVAVLLRVLQWASHVKDMTRDSEDMLLTIAAEAMHVNKAKSLREALVSHGDPTAIPQSLWDSLVDLNEPDNTYSLHRINFIKRQDVTETTDHDGETDLPPYRTSCNISWISGDAALKGLKQEFGSVIESSNVETKIQVGIDTEWGEAKENDGPCLVQLAQGGNAWIIDTSCPSSTTKSFFSWLFDHDRLQFLGFAFAHDVQKLGKMLNDQGTGLHTGPRHLVDLQKVAMAGEASKAHTPSLKRVAAKWLALDLDKSHQCSDWDSRPLSTAQLEYAAADAAVLLDLAPAMGLCPPKHLTAE